MADTAESRQEFDGKDQPDYLDMVKFYRESFNTVLTPEQEWRFHDWADQHKAKDILDALDDYDVRGAFLDGCELKGSPAKWPPKYAKPNFPMFSSESIYHGTADQHAGGEDELAPGRGGAGHRVGGDEEGPQHGAAPQQVEDGIIITTSRRIAPVKSRCSAVNRAERSGMEPWPNVPLCRSFPRRFRWTNRRHRPRPQPWPRNREPRLWTFPSSS